MRLPRQEDIALLFMAELARGYGQGPVPLSAVARDHGLSSLFPKKIARSLKRAGLVRSKEGADGGYVLERRPEAISVWDVLDAFSDARERYPTSMRSRRSCPIGGCLPQVVRRTVDIAMRDRLSGISLTDLKGGAV